MSLSLREEPEPPGKQNHMLIHCFPVYHDVGGHNISLTDHKNQHLILHEIVQPPLSAAVFSES